MVDSSETKAETSSSETKVNPNPEDKKISNVSANTIMSYNSPTQSGLFQRFDISKNVMFTSIIYSSNFYPWLILI